MRENKISAWGLRKNGNEIPVKFLRPLMHLQKKVYNYINFEIYQVWLDLLLYVFLFPFLRLFRL